MWFLSLFIIGHMGLFFYTKKGSIISTVDLPTTEIIEPESRMETFDFFGLYWNDFNDLKYLKKIKIVCRQPFILNENQNMTCSKGSGNLRRLEIGERSSFRSDADRTLLLFCFKVIGWGWAESPASLLRVCVNISAQWLIGFNSLGDC